MATFIMLPDGVTGTNEWDNPSGGTAAASNFDEDNDDTDYGRCINNEEISLTFADPSVDESAIGSITSVQIKTKSRYTNTVGVTSVNLKITMGSTDGGVTISNGTTLVAVAGSGTYQDINGGVMDKMAVGAGGNVPWSYDGLEALKVKLEGSGIFARFKRIRTSYVYAEVIYEPAGYGNSVMGVASGDISEVNDVASSNISKVIGV